MASLDRPTARCLPSSTTTDGASAAVCDQSLAHQLSETQRDTVLPAVDAHNFADSRLLVALVENEERCSIVKDYCHLVQQHVRPYMRRLVVEWMADVCQEEGAELEVFPLAVALMDRFLSVENIFAEQLQGLAAACLLIASKVKQPLPLAGKRLAAYTDYSVSITELITWELLTLSRLKWDVCSVTALDFAQQLLCRCALSAEQTAAIALDCYEALRCAIADYHFASVPPSVQASACLSLVAGRQSPTTADRLQRVIQCTLRVETEALRPYTEAVEWLVGRRDDDGKTSIPRAEHSLTPTDVRDAAAALL